MIRRLTRHSTLFVLSALLLMLNVARIKAQDADSNVVEEEPVDTGEVIDEADENPQE